MNDQIPEEGDLIIKVVVNRFQEVKLTGISGNSYMLAGLDDLQNTVQVAAFILSKSEGDECRSDKA